MRYGQTDKPKLGTGPETCQICGDTDCERRRGTARVSAVQMIGVPARTRDPAEAVDAEAVVIALETRTIPAAAAVAQSRAALEWLEAAGCRQFFFKYCSTFDSTDAGKSLEDAVYATEELEQTAKLYLLPHGRNPRCLTEVQIAELREAFSLP